MRLLAMVPALVCCHAATALAFSPTPVVLGLRAAPRHLRAARTVGPRSGAKLPVSPVRLPAANRASIDVRLPVPERASPDAAPAAPQLWGVQDGPAAGVCMAAHVDRRNALAAVAIWQLAELAVATSSVNLDARPCTRRGAALRRAGRRVTVPAAARRCKPRETRPS